MPKKKKVKEERMHRFSVQLTDLYDHVSFQQVICVPSGIEDHIKEEIFTNGMIAFASYTDLGVCDSPICDIAGDF